MQARWLAEAFGTFALVFAGTGAIVINQVSGGAITHPGIALTFGLIVMVMILSIGSVSGAHINPAVTLSFAACGRLPAREVLPYLLAQLLGALLASLLLLCLFPSQADLGATHPAHGAGQAFVLETVLSLLLMFVILSVATGSQERGLSAAVAIGGVVGLEALFAGPISGASMNPARSLAPALVSGQMAHLWVYLVAPVLGALLALPLCRVLHPAGACCTPGAPCAPEDATP